MISSLPSICLLPYWFITLRPFRNIDVYSPYPSTTHEKLSRYVVGKCEGGRQKAERNPRVYGDWWNLMRKLEEASRQKVDTYKVLYFWFCSFFLLRLLLFPLLLLLLSFHQQGPWRWHAHTNYFTSIYFHTHTHTDTQKHGTIKQTPRNTNTPLSPSLPFPKALSVALLLVLFLLSPSIVHLSIS
jgi:hypothetical protein